MVKKIIQDIVPLQREEPSKHHPSAKEKVHHAPVHTSVKKHAPAEEEEVEDVLSKSLARKESKKEKVMERSPIFEKMKQRHEERESFSDEYNYDKKNRFGQHLKIGSAIFGALLVIGYLIYGFCFYSATVTAHLKHVDVSLEKKAFQAKSEKGENTVTFQIMSLSEEQTAKLTPTGEKKIVKKASGKITVYNSFSAQSQVLIKNTRFETPDGKIFRIDSQVLVPGMKKVGGKDVPGFLEVAVSANETGPEYNIGPTDFTIPGFKGSPRFTKFYARSKTSMTGGVNGVVKTISDEDLKKAKDSLSESLKQKLLANASAQKPKGSVMYENAMFFTFTDTVDDSIQTGEKDVPLILKGTIDAVLFDETELGRSIVAPDISLNDNEQIKIGNIEKLDFAWKAQRGSAPEKTEILDFSLSGKANVVWVIDENALKNKLAGAQKNEFPRIMAQFLGVDKTIADFSPFWRSAFPKNPGKIYIKAIVD